GVELVDARGHVGCEELDDHLLSMHGARAVARDLHSGTGLPTARRREHALALDLDHARPAVAVRTVSRLVAEPRNLDAEPVGSLDDRLAGQCADVPAVQPERDDRLLESTVEGRVHGELSSCGKY